MPFAAGPPGEDVVARMGRAFGWSYDDLVMQVVDEALMRSQSHRAAAALVSGVSAA